MALKINKKLLPLKIHYFLKYGGIAFLTVLPVVAQQKGIPTLAVGLIWSVTPLTSCAINLLASTLADTFKVHRALFLAGMVVLSTSFVSIFLLPDISRSSSVETEAAVSLQCLDNNTRRLVVCSSEYTANSSILPVFEKCISDSTLDPVTEAKESKIFCKIHCTYPLNENLSSVDISENARFLSDIILNIGVGKSLYDACEDRQCTIVSETSTTPALSQSLNFTCGRKYNAFCTFFCGPPGSKPEEETTLADVAKTTEFWVISMLLVSLYGGNAISTTMADTVCFSFLGTARHKYGRQRMWGSVGWGIVGVVSGALTDYYSKGKSQVNYTPALIISIIFLGVNLLVALQIPFTISKKDKLKASSVGKAVCSFKMIIYLVTVTVGGLTMGMVWTFLFIIVEEVAIGWNPSFGHMKLLQGLMLGASVFLGEVPFLFLSGVSLGALVGGVLVESVGGPMAYFYLGLFDAAFTVFFIFTQLIIYRIDSKSLKVEQCYQNSTRVSYHLEDAETAKINDQARGPVAMPIDAV